MVPARIGMRGLPDAVTSLILDGSDPRGRIGTRGLGRVGPPWHAWCRSVFACEVAWTALKCVVLDRMRMRGLMDRIGLCMRGPGLRWLVIERNELDHENYLEKNLN